MNSAPVIVYVLTICVMVQGQYYHPGPRITGRSISTGPAGQQLYPIQAASNYQPSQQLYDGASNQGNSYTQQQAAYNQEPYMAAIRGSERNIKVIDMPSSGPGQTMTIHVPASQQPLTFVLRSRSSRLDLQSTHEPDSGSYQETSSEDQPHVMVHTVTRPVLQEIREIIAPYRKVTQEIKPVQETSETLVARTKQQYQQPATRTYSQPQKPKPASYRPAPKSVSVAPIRQSQQPIRTQAYQSQATGPKY